MKIPTITGTIDRRILINYHVDEDVLQKYLPSTFRPKLVEGKGIVGICLIRLRNIRPKGISNKLGISSENGAHRIAVEWSEEGSTKVGVFIPRRDTSSRLNYLAGGRIFPGVHHLAEFQVEEGDGMYNIELTSDDGTFLRIKTKESDQWSTRSVFEDLESASKFFHQGSVGYSPNKMKEVFDGIELKIEKWKVEPLETLEAESSFFEDETIFPKNTINFDSALIMKSIEHEWNSLRKLKSTVPNRAR